MIPRRTFLAGAGLTVLAPLAGCAKSTGLARQANSGAGRRAIGTVEQIAAAHRKAVLTVSGTTLTGQALSTASWRGKVVVLNYWGSWCPPCVKETPALREAWHQLRPKGVQFLGLDSQESAATGLAFMNANHLDYPSLAWDGGTFLLQLKGKAPAPPVTLVLDRQGRLAARVLSEVTTTTLVGLVEDVLAEAVA
ncbi:MAG: TlpA family protein disulfide reductase [Candidatus Dormibacteraeota bacterium]|nr:TlpA family protein disulfide reductase [Candidatus Dormibacteraeota bacterium]